MRSRFPLAVIAGLLLAASFPNIGIAGLAWIAPGLIVACALGKTGGESFRIGYVAGLAHYLASLYWLLLIPYRWHGIPLGPAAGWLALGAYLALYPALWVWMLCGLSYASSEVGPTPAAAPHKEEAISPVLTPADEKLGWPAVVSPRWTRRTLWALSGAALWVALEMVVARLFTGFPWNLLGASQFRLTPLIQIASVTGIYGVSFLAVWFSLALLSAALTVLRRPATRSAWVGEMLLPMLAVAVVFNLGMRHVRHAKPATRTFRITCVQPSIPQTLIWDESKDEERFRELLRLSELALTNQTDLLVWPEASVPKMLRYDKPTFDAVTNLAGSHHVWMIVGSDDAEPRAGPTNTPAADFYNSSFLVSPEGRLVKSYRKRALVVFGEYIPLVRWLPFVKWFTPIEGGFTPGRGPVAFRLTNLQVTTSVLICFEDIFPHLARDYAQEDTDFLINLTNNGWFSEGAAQWQHAISALFRTVENGLPLVRSANNGLTCWIDARGSLREIWRDSRGTIYGPGFMNLEVPLLPLGQTRSPTFYHQHGDWFGWTCVAIAVWMLLRRMPWRRVNRRPVE